MKNFYKISLKIYFISNEDLFENKFLLIKLFLINKLFFYFIHD